MDGVAVILAMVAFLLTWWIVGLSGYIVTILATTMLHLRLLTRFLFPLVSVIRLAAAIGASVLVYRYRVPAIAWPRKRSADEIFATISAVLVCLLVWWSTVIGFCLLAWLPAMQQHPVFQLSLMIPVGFVVGAVLGVVAAMSAYRRISRPSAAPKALSTTRSPIVAALRYLDQKIGLGTISIWLCLLQIPWAVANVMLLLLLDPHSNTPGMSPLTDEGYSILRLYYLAPVVLGVATGILAIACSSFRGQKLLGALGFLGGGGMVWAFRAVFHRH
jgi:hypothetical protein